MKTGGTEDTQIQYPHVSILDSGVFHVLDLRMLQIVTTKLKKQDELYKNVQEDLDNYLYFVPNYKCIYFPREFSTPKKYESEFHFKAMVCRDNGASDVVTFLFEMKKVNGDWKMQIRDNANFHNLYNRIVTRLKRDASDTWELMLLGKYGTTIQDGDKIDMRFMCENDRDVQLSGDILGHDWFPMTVRIIIPSEGISIPEEMMIQKQKYEVFDQFIRLASCNKEYEMALRKIMQVGIVKKLDLRMEKYIRLKHELRGVVYVKPKLLAWQKTHGEIDIVNDVAGPFYSDLIFTLPSVRLVQPNGTAIHRWVKFFWVKRDNKWFLKWNSTLSDPNMQITIKKKGSDTWSRVDLLATVYLLKGTEFNDGDQMNVRYVHGGVSHVVSYDSSSDQNLFPVTFKIILPS